jgi:hypothetical protein
MAETITDVELLQFVLESFDIDNQGYKDKTLHTLYINLSVGFKSIDRVDNIANIIYGFSENDFKKLKRFFGLFEDDKEDYFSGLVGEIKDKNLSTPLGTLDESFSEKFAEHIRLCCFQRDFMSNISQRAEEMAKKTINIASEANATLEIVNEAISESKQSAKDAKELSVSAEKVAKSAEKVKGKIYSEFIAILGIFTAISFMSMGSLQVLGDLFKDVKDPTSASVGYALIIGGIYISIMYVFVIIMFVGMKKVVGNGDSYNFSFGVCALVLITIAALFGTGLFITGHVVPGLMILTICVVGLIVSFLATHPMATESK